MEVRRQIILAGGNVIDDYRPDEIDRKNVNRTMLEHGSEQQLKFSPVKYYKGLVRQIDHHILIMSTPDVNALEGIDPDKTQLLQGGIGPFYTLRTKKENANKLSWTMCSYGTASMARAVGMTEREYWREIINACYLREKDPVAKWKKIMEEKESFKAKLNAMKIQSLHVKGKDVDLHLTIGSNRKWLGGTGRNMPSFEIFTSPNWKGTRGWIRFNQPLNHYGKTITGHYVEFGKGGVITKAGAKRNQKAFLAMLAEHNANKVGEFSLTDANHSPIRKPMGDILYTENTGGRFGNTHIAVGNAYRDAYTGDITKPSDAHWHNVLGFNHCKTVHTDLISTTDRTVTATLKNGKKKIIYQNGHFTLD